MEYKPLQIHSLPTFYFRQVFSRGLGQLKQDPQLYWKKLNDFSSKYPKNKNGMSQIGSLTKRSESKNAHFWARKIGWTTIFLALQNCPNGHFCNANSDFPMYMYFFCTICRLFDLSTHLTCAFSQSIFYVHVSVFNDSIAVFLWKYNFLVFQAPDVKDNNQGSYTF